MFCHGNAGMETDGTPRTATWCDRPSEAIPVAAKHPTSSRNLCQGSRSLLQTARIWIRRWRLGAEGGQTVGVWDWLQWRVFPVLLALSSASFSRSNAEDPKAPLSRTSDSGTRGGSSVAQRAPHNSSLNSRGLPVAPGNCPGIVIFGPEAVR